MEVAVSHNNDASPDFITDVILYNIDKPAVKVFDKGSVSAGDSTVFPRFTVLKARRDTRTYGKGKLAHSVVVYKFCLMDGSETVFKAVTNSGLSFLLEEYDILPGMTLIVKDWAWVRMEAITKKDFNIVMLIKNMGWILPPYYERFSPYASPPRNQFTNKIVMDYEAAVVENPPKPMAVKVSKVCVDFCERSGTVQFTVPHADAPGTSEDMCNYPVTTEKYLNGDWIVDAKTRCEWMDFAKSILTASTKRKRDEDSDEDDDSASGECRCLTEFGLLQCAVTSFPISSLDLEQLYLCCARRVHGEMKAESFDTLPHPKHKRWCLYWWYAVNIYQIRGSATPLPPCLLEYVRNEYPNDSGETYTGFRNAQERAEQADT